MAHNCLSFKPQHVTPGTDQSPEGCSHYLGVQEGLLGDGANREPAADDTETASLYAGVLLVAVQAGRLQGTHKALAGHIQSIMVTHLTMTSI